MKISKISKIEGLRKIELYGIPHPDWHFVEQVEELGDTLKRTADKGWTVRTSYKRSVDVANLPFANQLPAVDVPKKINEFRRKMGRDAIFIVYPSWDFIKSGSVLLLEDEVIIEAIAGALFQLTDGIKTPNITVKYDKFTRQISDKYGDKNFLQSSEIGRLLRIHKMVPEINVVLEWSHTHHNEYLFHHWIEF